jgi:hypothetical protein
MLPFRQQVFQITGIQIYCGIKLFLVGFLRRHIFYRIACHVQHAQLDFRFQEKLRLQLQEIRSVRPPRLSERPVRRVLKLVQYSRPNVSKTPNTPLICSHALHIGYLHVTRQKHHEVKRLKRSVPPFLCKLFHLVRYAAYQFRR